MELTISGNKYKLEYSFEAVLCEECVEKVVELLGSVAAVNEAEDGEKASVNAKDALKQLSSIASTTVTLFYAGLLENGLVESEAEAKVLLKQYFKENPDAENATFYGMATEILGQMEKDGFFKQIGLTGEEAETTPKVPQDHKPKATAKKASEK